MEKIYKYKGFDIHKLEGYESPQFNVYEISTGYCKSHRLPYCSTLAEVKQAIRDYLL